MSLYAIPVLFALFAWWFVTGVILYLDLLPARTFRRSMAGATAVLGLSLWGLTATRDDASVTGALAAFACGLLVWGWQEMSFFTGFVTGPRRIPCGAAQGWRRFRRGFAACAYHEVAIVIGALATVWATSGGANRVGLWTYLLLWAMRTSAKLNVFLGVRNLNEEFVPAHLAYLTSYFARRPLNAFFPFAVTAATVGAGLLVWAAAMAADPFAATGSTLLATMAVLGVVEHWFLVLPLPAAALWGWSLRPAATRPSPIAVPSLPVPSLPIPSLPIPSTPWRQP
jgi:putative photosynthetic complex assembly protein 2